MSRATADTRRFRTISLDIAAEAHVHSFLKRSTRPLDATFAALVTAIQALAKAGMQPSDPRQSPWVQHSAECLGPAMSGIPHEDHGRCRPALGYGLKSVGKWTTYVGSSASV